MYMNEKNGLLIEYDIDRIYDSILSDHKAVTEPDYKTPFKSKQDVIDRLLPYHIYQYPKVDMDANKIPVDKQGMFFLTMVVWVFIHIGI